MDRLAARAKNSPKESEPNPEGNTGDSSTIPEAPSIAASDSKPAPVESGSLAGLLRSGKEEEKIVALAQIAKLGTNGKAYSEPIVRYGLMSTHKKIVEAALIAFEKVEPTLYPTVVTLMTDGSKENRIRAIETLGRSHEFAKCTMPLLRLAYSVEVQNPNGASHALLSGMLQIDPQDDYVSKVALSLISGQTLVDPKNRYNRYGENLRRDSLLAIAKIKGDDGRKIDSLVSGLRNSDNTVLILETLASYGTQAAKAVPTLMKYKTHADATVRNAATTAIAKIER